MKYRGSLGESPVVNNRYHSSVTAAENAPHHNLRPFFLPHHRRHYTVRGNPIALPLFPSFIVALLYIYSSVYTLTSRHLAHDHKTTTGEAFLLDISQNQTYTGECRQRYLYNQTWGEAVAPLVDKLLVKDLLTQQRIDNLRLVPTLAFYTPDTIHNFTQQDFINLNQGDGAIIKPSHMSGGVAKIHRGYYRCFKKCVTKNADPAPMEDAYPEALQNMQHDITNSYHKAPMETQYLSLSRGIIIEQRLRIEEEGMMEYHWWVANGHPVFVCIRCNTAQGAGGSYYSTRFHRLNVHVEGLRPCRPDLQAPRTWSKMLRMVQEMDVPGVVRIDLYASNAHIYFSEFTFTNNGCRIFFEPLVVDAMLYGLLHQQLTPRFVSAETVERYVNNEHTYVLTALFHESHAEDDGSPISTLHPNSWTMCRRSKLFGGNFSDCFDLTETLKAEYPLRCVAINPDHDFILVGQWRIPSCETVLQRVDWPWALLLFLVWVFLKATHLGLQRHRHQGKAIFLYLGSVVTYKYFQPSCLGLLSPYFFSRSISGSIQIFQYVHHPSSPAIGWTHAGTYWFQLMAWRSTTVQGVLVWYLLYESVAAFANEYVHMAEETDYAIRCARVSFIQEMKQYAVDDTMRSYLLPPILVYGYLLPKLLTNA